jgi:hypothetical protein
MTTVKLTFALAVLAVAPIARAEKTPRIKVELQSDRENTTLLRMTRAGGVVGARVYGSVVGVAEWYQPVCTAPCAVDADPNAIYRVAGRGVTPSDSFALPPASEKVGLRVRAGSSAVRAGGWLSVGLGALAVATGGALFLVGSIMAPNASDAVYENDPSRYKRDDDRASTFRSIGLVSLGAGAAALALGIALVATSGTGVETDRGQTLALSLGTDGIVF